MRRCLVLLWLASIYCVAQQAASQSVQPQPQAPQPRIPTEFGNGLQPKPTPDTSPEEKLRYMFQEKIKAEWEAIKNKDKKAYSELLAEDYVGVEADGRGERSKAQTVNELLQTSPFHYTLWAFSMVPAGPDAAFLTYEVSMQFPPKSAVHFSRVYIGELWEKRDGQWKEVRYQETNVK